MQMKLGDLLIPRFGQHRIPFLTVLLILFHSASHPHFIVPVSTFLYLYKQMPNHAWDAITH